MKSTTLKNRGEFLRVAAAKRKWAMPGILVQVAHTPAHVSAEGVRYGVTASRKVGNAVVRNRAKRRLRALAGQYLNAFAAPGHDFVLIARRETADRSFDDLILDLKTAVTRLKVARPAEPGRDQDG